MPHETKIVSGVEVVPLCDAVGPMGSHIRKPLPEMFPGGVFEEGEEWILHFHCYLLRAAGRTVLVDTGIGGTGSPAAGWAPVPGRLPEELSAVGVAPEDVDLVVLTHLHSDHASGCVGGDGPAFPNARYAVQRADLDWVRGPMLDQVVAPLRDSLQILDGTTQLLPGITAVHTPGHTPGHQTVEVGDLALSGDVVLHPVQLRDPAITYVYDEDPELAARSRTALLERVAVLATGHFPEPFTPTSAR
ncbi:MBL fold metallo-hydrolase [Microtetraspora fusca]|uniref:MBL fold metallo-hydrolase n=1 Tax=Microtetraspora fusca TaxID=1997 RepID=A0ABW6VB14_MICFU|nr:MBL fold metallo-hydrolase [Microtetraspora fusca]